METHLDNLAKELASKYKRKAALFGKDGVVNTLIQKTLQAALDGELTDHLGYHKHVLVLTPAQEHAWGANPEYT
jgi:transposase-like protein